MEGGKDAVTKETSPSVEPIRWVAKCRAGNPEAPLVGCVAAVALSKAKKRIIDGVNTEAPASVRSGLGAA
jgi:hypothetical protein